MTILKHIISSFSLLLMVFLLGSCNSSASTDQQNEGTTSNGDGQRILDKEVFTAQIKKSGAVVIDVRSAAEYEQSHIDKAMHIDFFDPEFKYKLLDLNRKKKYYLYCKNENKSYRAMKFMEDNNFKDVYMLKGGYQDWNTAKSE